MLRMCAVSATLVGAALAGVGFSAPALAAPASSGMAAEFPVGSCMDIPNDAPADFLLDNDDLLNVASVPCTDPARDYRVVKQVQNFTQCGPAINYQFTTRDVVVLCVVQDYDKTISVG